MRARALRFVGCGVVVVAGLVGQPAASAGEPLALARYFDVIEEDDQGNLEKITGRDVGIDHRVLIEWKEDLLRAALVDRESPARPLSDEQHLRTLRELVVRFLDAQVLLTNAVALGPGGRSAAPEVNLAHDRFGAAASDTLRSLQAHLEALEAAGLDADASRLEQASMSAIQQDYAALASVLSAEIDELAARVRAALAEATRSSVQVRATLVSTVGRRRLHVAGYDRIEEGEATETPRFQWDLDARAEAEVRAADQLGEVVRQALSGELGDRLEASLEAVREELGRLEMVIEKDVLEGNLRQALDQMEAAGDAGLQPAVDQGEELLATLRALSADTIPFPADGQAELLLAVVRSVSSHVQAVVAEVRALDERLGEFLATVRRIAEEQPGIIAEDALAALDGSLRTIEDDPDVAAVLDSLESVRASLGLTSNVASDALAAGAEIPRDVSSDLDTWVDLMRAGERHSGELLLIEAELGTVDGDRVEPRARAYRRLRVRLVGLRLEPRGSLVLADSRDSRFADQSWEPSAAVSYMLHWGKKDSRLWNDLLDPGVGLTVTLLDFSDDSDFELGLAGSVSLFRSLLWAGYGRNIQEESNFFYLGINPLVVGKIWNEQRQSRQ